MSRGSKGTATVEVPVKVLEKYLAAQESLEDWLMANDDEFIKKMKRAREEDLSGKVVSWAQAKKNLSQRGRVG